MTLLSNVITGKTTRPRTTLLYGLPGIGKSTFASAFPSPIFIQTEKGLEDIGVDRFPVCTSWECVNGYAKALYTEEHNYKTVVVDSLSALEPLIWAQVCEDKGKKNIEDIGYAKGYVFALDYWRMFVAALDYLRADKNMNIVLIGHSKVSRVNDPEHDPYDQFDIDIDKRASAFLIRWSDEVFFANYEIFTTEKGEGFNKRVKAIGDGTRKLFTGERPGRKAKNRLNMPESIPMTWESYSSFLSK